MNSGFFSVTSVSRVHGLCFVVCQECLKFRYLLENFELVLCTGEILLLLFFCSVDFCFWGGRWVFRFVVNFWQRLTMIYNVIPCILISSSVSSVEVSTCLVNKVHRNLSQQVKNNSVNVKE